MSSERRSCAARPISTILLALFLAGCSSPVQTPAPTLIEPTIGPTADQPVPTPAAEASRDIIFHNGVLLTMDDAQPAASAIHIQGEKIVSVGDEAAILAEAGPATQVIDLQGLTLMPGFVDPHTHLFHAGASFGQNDITSQDEALSLGVTSIGELWADQGLIEHLRELDSSGELRVRTSVYPTPYNDGCGNIYDQGWYRAYLPGAELGQRLRIGGIKIYTDGGGCNAPAVSFEYAGGVGNGTLYFTQDELDRVVADFHGQGYQLAIHAMGDRGIEQALNAVAAAQSAFPRAVHHRLEHVAVVRPDLIPRFDETGTVAVMFGGYPTCWLVNDSQAFSIATPAEYLDWEWPRRAFHEAAPDAHVAYHSDAPGVRPISPFENLYGMVTRQEVAEDGTLCQPPADLGANAVSVEQALHDMTLEGAYALGQEAELGSLTPGKLADMILLTENPLNVPSERLRALGVIMTMVGGQVAHCAQGYDAFCPKAASVASPMSTQAAAPASFRDEFNGGLDPGWTWTKEDPAAWSLTDTPGWLRIDLSQGGFLTATPSNVLLRPAPQSDFTLSTILRVSPTRNFELAGLLVTFADGRVLQFGRADCDVPGVCTGGGYYFDNIKDGTTTSSNHALPGFAGSQYVLRLERRGATYSAYYLTVDGQPVAAGSHTVAEAPQSVGLIAAQAPTPGPVAAFDVFEITSP